jgi:hypothetical protein
MRRESRGAEGKGAARLQPRRSLHFPGECESVGGMGDSQGPEHDAGPRDEGAERAARDDDFSRRQLLRAGSAIPVVLSTGFLAACGSASHDDAHGDHTDAPHDDAAHTDTHSDGGAHSDHGHSDTGGHNDSGTHDDTGGTHDDPGGTHNDTGGTHDDAPKPPHTDVTGSHADFNIPGGGHGDEPFQHGDAN